MDSITISIISFLDSLIVAIIVFLICVFIKLPLSSVAVATGFAFAIVFFLCFIVTAAVNP